MKPRCTLAIALVLLVAPARGTDLLQVDFDNAIADPTQAGWEAFSDTGDANNKSVSYSGYTDLATSDITITTSGVEFTRNYNNGGGAAPDFPGTDLDKVANDLILRNDTGSPLDITIEGLSAGVFQITTHHLVGSDGPATSEFDLLVQDADSSDFAQTVGNFAMGKSSEGLTSPDFLVTSNGVDPVVLRLSGTFVNPAGGTLNWIGINGLEVTVPATEFQLDFNHRSVPNQRTQAGWAAFNPTSDATANGTASYPGFLGLSSGDITITTSNMEFARTGNQSDAAAVDVVGDGSLDDMYYDLIFRNDATASPQVSIGGLLAGSYRVTTYHHITDAGATKTSFDLEVQDADSSSFGQTVGNFTMGNDITGPTIVTFDVTSNGTDPILLRLTANPLGPGGTGNWFGFNGLEVTIPEPATPTAPLELVIAPNVGNPGNYDFSWNSKAGKVYDLVSSTALGSAPETWEVWNGNADIAASPDTNTLSNVPGSDAAKRFFSVVEKDAP